MSYNHNRSLLMLLATAHGVKHRNGEGSDGLLFLLMIAGVCSQILVDTADVSLQSDRSEHLASFKLCFQWHMSDSNVHAALLDGCVFCSKVLF